MAIMKYNDNQTEIQQILETIRGYGAVMASLVIGAILMFALLIRIAQM